MLSQEIIALMSAKSTQYYALNIQFTPFCQLGVVFYTCQGANNLNILARNYLLNAGEEHGNEATNTTFINVWMIGF